MNRSSPPRPGPVRLPGFAEAQTGFAGGGEVAWRAPGPLTGPRPWQADAPPELIAWPPLRMPEIQPGLRPWHPPARTPAVQRAAKRLLDLAVSLTVLALAAPLMVLVAAALWREGGPILFAQTRIGRHRVRFRCLKFRTMRVDAEARLAATLNADRRAAEEWRRHQKLSRDPRVTALGRFLRATSLDELPQLFNVLRGEMSLVGPRPVIAPEIDGYDADRAYYLSRAFADYADCLPGITGLWQVSGRHRTSHRDRVRMDLWYARNRSLWLDLRILLRTVPVVLGRTGG